MARILGKLEAPRSYRSVPPKSDPKLHSIGVAASQLSSWIHACQPVKKGVTEVVHNFGKPDDNWNFGHLAQAENEAKSLR